MRFGQVLTFPLKIFFDYFSLVYKRKLAISLLPLLPKNSKILDVGCGDGTVAWEIISKEPSLKIQGIDIQARSISKIPMKVYDGKKIPYEDDSFDVVMATDVLHHTYNIPALLREMARAAKKYVIVRDHVSRGIFSYLLICFTDFISNVPYGVKCAFNYPPWAEWEKYFKNSGLRVVNNVHDLDFGFGIDGTYNILVKLERIK